MKPELYDAAPEFRPWGKTPRERFHKVSGEAPVSWVLSLRGPWAPSWIEENEHGLQILADGREVVAKMEVHFAEG